jgi:glutaredoxin
MKFEDFKPRSRPLGQPALALGLGTLVFIGMTLIGCNPTAGNGQKSYEQKLAEHLTMEGGVMYGAFWCPHCATQKELFGDAAKAVPYIECDPKGEAAQPQVCVDKGIQGYPTWEINGELYTGTRTLKELATLSGFE